MKRSVITCTLVSFCGTQIFYIRYKWWRKITIKSVSMQIFILIFSVSRLIHSQIRTNRTVSQLLLWTICSFHKASIYVRASRLDYFYGDFVLFGLDVSALSFLGKDLTLPQTSRCQCCSLSVQSHTNEESPPWQLPVEQKHVRKPKRVLLLYHCLQTFIWQDF